LCINCGKKILKPKHEIQKTLAGSKQCKSSFCSISCSRIYHGRGSRIVSCTKCGKSFKKEEKEIRKSKTGRHFCSRSCSVTYHNTHKTKGTRRSKLEAWIEEQLSKLHPNLEIYFNNKDAINSELDIYIPSLKLAFELNGIFHYEPIYGEEKLASTQNNDNRKFQACLDQNIELCIIDTSGQKYFKEKSSQKYLDIITNILNSKLSNS
jgi:hypothetical protein